MIGESHTHGKPMPTTVELEMTVQHGSGVMPSRRTERWKYPDRDLALCRVTQLLVAYPEADVKDELKGAILVRVYKESL